MEEPVAVRPVGGPGGVADGGGNESRIALISDNLAAFALRALGARSAVRVLDLQYYIWAEDLTGQLLAREVLRAADRGARVRMLLDDLYVRRATERELVVLAHHPRIEVRLYNPFQLRAFGLLGDAVEFLFASYRLNHRMHNKAWIVDDDFAIAGGRNIGDEYFGAASQFNFRDLDLLVGGPAAQQAGAIFDRYWYHPRARPIGEIATLRLGDGELAELREKLEASARSAQAPAYLKSIQAAEAAEDAGPATNSVALASDAVRLIADPPGKGRGRRRDRRMYKAILRALRDASAEAFLISPYFVPGRRGSRVLTDLARRGVRVSVLTNSLAATDVLAVHGRYERYRKRLLRAGVHVYELKHGGQEGKSLFGSVGASLHTKAFGVDGRLIFVGSFNFDPRSANLNTEMGAFVENGALAAELGREFARLTDAERSW
ncbi:MAG: phospholipase D-like domain-containing protein, partial [Acetobacteraceae bacterium]